MWKQGLTGSERRTWGCGRLARLALILGLALAPAAVSAQGLPKAAEARVAAALGAEDYFDFYWFPTPEGDQALAIAYYPIPGAAGNFQVGAGLFKIGGGEAKLQGTVDLFGTEPRDAAFGKSKIEVTTTMPKPDDPRCCPTGKARWIIDRKTGAVKEQ